MCKYETKGVPAGTFLDAAGAPEELKSMDLGTPVDPRYGTGGAAFPVDRGGRSSMTPSLDAIMNIIKASM